MFSIMLLILFVLGLIIGVISILNTLFIIGAVILFIAAIVIYNILKNKDFFNKYNEGWKRVLTKVLKYGLILEMIGNVITFIICIYVKIKFGI